MILSMSNIYNLDFSITFTNESDTFLKNKKPLKTEKDEDKDRNRLRRPSPGRGLGILVGRHSGGT